MLVYRQIYGRLPYTNMTQGRNEVFKYKQTDRHAHAHNMHSFEMLLRIRNTTDSMFYQKVFAIACLLRCFTTIAAIRRALRTPESQSCLLVKTFVKGHNNKR